jgi:hypothetical protein
MNRNADPSDFNHELLMWTWFYETTNIIFLLFYNLQVFGTPKEHRKSKPFHDHVFVFSIVDDHVWFRNYQVILFFFILMP